MFSGFLQFQFRSSWPRERLVSVLFVSFDGPAKQNQKLSANSGAAWPMILLNTCSLPIAEQKQTVCIQIEADISNPKHVLVLFRWKVFRKRDHDWCCSFRFARCKYTKKMAKDKWTCKVNNPYDSYITVPALERKTNLLCRTCLWWNCTSSTPRPHPKEICVSKATRCMWKGELTAWREATSSCAFTRNLAVLQVQKEKIICPHVTYTGAQEQTVICISTPRSSSLCDNVTASLTAHWMQLQLCEVLLQGNNQWGVETVGVFS